MRTLQGKSSGSWFGVVALAALVSAGPAACNGDGGDLDGDETGGTAGAEDETGGTGTDDGSGGDPGDGSGGTAETTGGSGGTAAGGGSGGAADGMGGLGGEGGMAGGASPPDCEGDAERTIACASGASGASQAQVCVGGSWQDEGACTCDNSAEEYDAVLASCVDPIACDEGASPFGGGDGSELDPFLICTFEQLDAVRGALDQHFVLAQSLDLSTVEDFVPIGSTGAPFVGVFDGAGRALVGLQLAQPDLDYVGLFGTIGSGYFAATVRDVVVRDFVVEGRDYVGALAGQALGMNSLVENVSVDGGSVQAQTVVGGLAGYGAGTVRGCASSAEVSGLGGESAYFGTSAGGLLGEVVGVIEASSASGDVTGASGSVGGLVGMARNSAEITGSFATGAVTGGGGVGGLVGFASVSTIENSFASGAASGESSVGGLVGGCEGGTVLMSFASGTATVAGMAAGGLVGQLWGSGALVGDSYATGDVSGDGYLGGLVGYAQNLTTVSNSYALGHVSEADDTGGLVGMWTATAATSSSYFLDGEPENGRGASLSLAEFADQASFVDWDFVDIWVMSANAGRPVLQWE